MAVLRSDMSVLVLAPYGDLEIQQFAEEAIVAEARAVGVAMTAYHELFPPGTDYTPETFARRLTDAGVNAILLVEDQSTAAPVTSSMTTVLPPCSAAPQAAICVPWNQSTALSTTRSQQQSFRISGALIDVTGSSVIWRSTTTLERNGVSDQKVLGALAEDIVESLPSDGVIG